MSGTLGTWTSGQNENAGPEGPALTLRIARIPLRGHAATDYPQLYHGPNV